MPSSSIATPTIAERPTLREAILIALYDAASGSPVPRIALGTIATSARTNVEAVFAQLLVLESLGMAFDIDRSGASIDPRGVMLVERMLAGEDVLPSVLH